MKATELMKKSEADIHKLLAEWRSQLAQLHRERFTSEAKNVRQARAVRKDIARSLTILRSLHDPDAKKTETDISTKEEKD
jgi:ribosomal protein L29